jgi:ppGpp synthetase/RelA/SpoT-type nucleotidyltranferase
VRERQDSLAGALSAKESVKARAGAPGGSEYGEPSGDGWRRRLPQLVAALPDAVHVDQHADNSRVTVLSVRWGGLDTASRIRHRISKVTGTEHDEDLEDVATEKIKKAARNARSVYEAELGLYEDYARSLKAILDNCATEDSLNPHSIAFRAKTPESFEEKASRISAANPSEPKYSDPLTQITDKAGVRVITYFLSALDAFDSIIREQFDVVEKLTKSSGAPDRFGYQSVHYLVRLRLERTAWPEYRRFAGLVAEIQVRTILQHAWAEIEHDMQYKAVAALPTKVQRRFAALAGLIEIADREFQAIEDEEIALRDEARKNVDLGRLDAVEVTEDSLKAYLDRKYGPDGRMKRWAYASTAGLLRDLGFQSLAQVDDCVSSYNDDQISRVIHGGRMGQLTRFESVLLTAMGSAYVIAHPWFRGVDSWFAGYSARGLSRLRNAGIQIGSHRPLAYPDSVVKADEIARLEAILNGSEDA